MSSQNVMTSLLYCIVICSFDAFITNRFLNSNNGKLLIAKKFATTTTTDNLSTEEIKKEPSFIQDELRPYAMKLHTRDQAPKEGQKPAAPTPFTKWEVQRKDYLQFLADSLIVYETLEELTNSIPELSVFKSTGLERAACLREDIAWICEYDKSLASPTSGQYGIEYSAFLRQVVKESLPRFLCHYYNHYFAHTAGGRMIGKRMADNLLQGKTLKFYQWDGDLKQMQELVLRNIDNIAKHWSEAEKEVCKTETMACFKYGGSLMKYMSPPEH